jgi:hypothetical protein
MAFSGISNEGPALGGLARGGTMPLPAESRDEKRNRRSVEGEQWLKR